MRRTPIKPRRPSPRRREAPRWTAQDWAGANELLLARCNGDCELCGKPLAGRMERAHRVRRTVGGDRLSNILALHPECHAWTHAHPLQAIVGGWILGTTTDPAATPVLWCGHTPSLLADDGTREPVTE